MVKRASGGDASWLARQAEAPSNQQEITEEAQEGASSEHAPPKNCCVEFFIMRVVRDSADSPDQDMRSITRTLTVCCGVNYQRGDEPVSLSLNESGF